MERSQIEVLLNNYVATLLPTLRYCYVHVFILLYIIFYIEHF
jgi:hypothetical protein